MLRLFLFAISIFLIPIIFLRVPQESTGLGSFATKSNLFSSPTSAQKTLNLVTGVGILLYLILAIQSNISS